METNSEMPPWFIAFYQQYVRQRDEMQATVRRYAPALPTYRSSTTSRSAMESNAAEEEDARELGVADLEHGDVDPMVYKKMAMEITLLEGGILSVITGGRIMIENALTFIKVPLGLCWHDSIHYNRGIRRSAYRDPVPSDL
jgi:zinc transporter 1/2/3